MQFGSNINDFLRRCKRYVFHYFETSDIRLKKLGMFLIGVNFPDVSDLSFALCADQKGFIRCEKGNKIRVKSAIYGRTDNKVCPGGNTNTRTCRSLTSEMKVKWSCNGYRTCHLHASSQIFGNPCMNVSKYLQVTYGCVKNPDGKGMF